MSDFATEPTPMDVEDALASPNNPPPPKNPEEKEQNLTSGTTFSAPSGANYGDQSASTTSSSTEDPNPLAFPPPGALLGRVIGGAPGQLQVKLIPNDPTHAPIFQTYTKRVHAQARFRKHCPVIARIDEDTGEITDLKEDLIFHHWTHYPPIPGIVQEVSETGVIKLRAEIESTGIGGFESSLITTYKSRLQAPFMPHPKTRVWFYGVVTQRTKKQKGSNRMPRQERFIDIIHIEINKTPLIKTEKQILFPPLRDYLMTTLKIDIEIGTSTLTDSPNSYGALQTAMSHKDDLIDIITHAENTTERALTLDEHKNTARKLKRAFSKSPPQLNLLIKPRKHLNINITDINNQLNKNPKLRRIIANIYLILPADPQTNPKNPYHNNPHILTDIHNSDNNFASNIIHISQPTFEGSYDAASKCTTHKRASNLKTYNIIQFKPQTSNHFSDKHTVLPEISLLDTPSFTDQTDEDASDIDAPPPTDYIHVAYPTTDQQREHRANRLMTDIHKTYEGIQIDLLPQIRQGWRELKLELGLLHDSQTIIEKLTTSDALVSAMDENCFTDDATSNYTLVAKTGKLTNASALAVLRVLGYTEGKDHVIVENQRELLKIRGTYR